MAEFSADCFKSSNEGYISGFPCDDTLSCIEITNKGVALAEKLVSAKNNISIIDDLDNNYKDELTEVIPDLMAGTPNGVKSIPRVKYILANVTTGAGEIIKSVISDIASETILKSMGLH